MEKRQSFMNSEFRTREEENRLFFDGYFIRYNAETQLYKGVYEEVDQRAVMKSLKNNDIRCLFNHNKDIVLGRTGNNTLSLRSDNNGLFGSVEINQDDLEAMAIYARVKRGDISACSFGFNLIKQDHVKRDDGSSKFILRDINLFEVSVVTFPAYPQTQISARQKDIAQFEKEQLEYKKKLLKERLNK